MATNYNIVKIRDWNPVKDSFSFKKPTINPSGGLNINFTYNGNRLYLRTPKMRCPFGVGRTMDDKGFNLQLTFDPDNEEAMEFKEKADLLDKTMLELGMEKCFEWNLAPTKGKIPSMDVIESKYKSLVKYPKFAKSHARAGEINPEYPPYIQVSLPQTHGKANPESDEVAQGSEFITELYNAEKQPILMTENAVPKGSRCSALIYGSGWSTTSGYGISFKAAQLMVFPRAGLPTGQCLIDDEGVEDEFEEMEGESAEDLDEQAEEEVVEEAPTPAPVVVKAVTPTPVVVPKVEETAPKTTVVKKAPVARSTGKK